MGETAEKILHYLKNLLEEYLRELSGIRGCGFLYGEKIAYTECLEIIQQWNDAKCEGLNYDVEKRYPI